MRSRSRRQDLADWESVYDAIFIQSDAIDRTELTIAISRYIKSRIKHIAVNDCLYTYPVKMATTTVQHPLTVEHSGEVGNTRSEEYTPRNVVATLNYFKDNEDGSPPAPNYVNKPESYRRPISSQSVTIHDIRGLEDHHSLDTTGSQIVKHRSVEKDFVDDDEIKRVYYREIETLLKNVYRPLNFLIKQASYSFNLQHGSNAHQDL